MRERGHPAERVPDEHDRPGRRLVDDGGEVTSEGVDVEGCRPVRAVHRARVPVAARVVGDELVASVGAQVADEVVPDHVVLDDAVREDDRRVGVLGTVDARVELRAVVRLDPERAARRPTRSARPARGRACREAAVDSSSSAAPATAPAARTPRPSRPARRRLVANAQLPVELAAEPSACSSPCTVYVPAGLGDPGLGERERALRIDRSCARPLA